mgnify:CR=1 FL=1
MVNTVDLKRIKEYKKTFESEKNNLKMFLIVHSLTVI